MENEMKTNKRHSDDIESSKKKIKTSDVEVLKEMQDKLTNSDLTLDAEIELTKQKYFVSYFKKVLKELPASMNVIDIDLIEETREGFFRSFSIAKTCVHAHLQFKKIIAFNSVYDMVSGVIGKFFHGKIIAPAFKNFLSEVSLKNAFLKYQEALMIDDNDKLMELQSITYLIQCELEKSEPLKIPNPITNRFTQQMTACSKYVIELLKEIALRPFGDEPSSSLIKSK